MTEEIKTPRPLLPPEAEAALLGLFERMLNLPTIAEKWEPSNEDENIINDFMRLMDEEMKKYAEELIRIETREKIISRGPQAITIIKTALTKGQKPKLKRKKGCIFIQFGEGTPEDPIEEIMIAST